MGGEVEPWNLRDLDFTRAVHNLLASMYWGSHYLVILYGQTSIDSHVFESWHRRGESWNIAKGTGIPKRPHPLWFVNLLQLRKTTPMMLSNLPRSFNVRLFL